MTIRNKPKDKALTDLQWDKSVVMDCAYELGIPEKTAYNALELAYWEYLGIPLYQYAGVYLN